MGGGARGSKGENKEGGGVKLEGYVIEGGGLRGECNYRRAGIGGEW